MIGQTSKSCRGIFLAFVSLISYVAFAQEGTISGRITDPAGGVAPGVTVTATNVDTGIKAPTLTNEVGRYVFPFLPPGHYQLAAEMTGFKRMVRPAIKFDP